MSDDEDCMQFYIEEVGEDDDESNTSSSSDADDVEDDLDDTENITKFSSRSFKTLSLYERTKLIGIRTTQLQKMAEYKDDYVGEKTISQLKRKYGSTPQFYHRLAELEYATGKLPLSIKRLNGDVL